MRKFNLTSYFFLPSFPYYLPDRQPAFHIGVSTPTIRTAQPEYIIRKEASAWK